VPGKMTALIVQSLNRTPGPHSASSPAQAPACERRSRSPVPMPPRAPERSGLDLRTCTKKLTQKQMRMKLDRGHASRRTDWGDNVMRGLLLSTLLLAAMGSASGVANAQPGLSTGMNTDGIDRNRRIEEDQRRASTSYARPASRRCRPRTSRSPKEFRGSAAPKTRPTSDAERSDGSRQDGSQEWPEAKQFLEIAIVEEAQASWPKARLAVAAIMANDIPLATSQRAELVSMKARCNSSCPEASLITGNLAMVDKVIARCTHLAGCATPAPATTN